MFICCKVSRLLFWMIFRDKELELSEIFRFEYCTFYRNYRCSVWLYMMDCCNYSFYRIIMFILPITVLRKVELYWNNRRKFAQRCFIKIFCKAKLFYVFGVRPQFVSSCKWFWEIISSFGNPVLKWYHAIGTLCSVRGCRYKVPCMFPFILYHKL